MKFSAVAVAALITVAASQGISELPKCAQVCAGKGFPAECGADVKCICTSSSFLDAITCCVATSCNSDEQKKTIQFAKGICGGVGVNVPDSAVCPTASSSGPGAPSSTAAPSGSTSETGSVTGTAITGTVSPTGTSSPSGSATESGSSSTTHSTGSGSPTTSSTRTPTQTGNAASSVNANGGLLAAIAALVVAVA
ncbi:hypothetical protein MaudCBS49596_004888 [Microsporum audouinii]